MKNTVKVRGKGVQYYIEELKLWEHGYATGIPKEFVGKTQKTYKGKTLGEIATIHEFGLGKIPQRSFIRDWFDEQKDRILKVLGKISLQKIRASNVLGSVQRQRSFIIQETAEKLTKSCTARIRARIPPPNAPRTLEHKHGDTPLIDLGLLISSIRTDIMEGGLRMKRKR